MENIVATAVHIGDDGIGLTGLGHESFEIQFQAQVEYEADVEYDDPTSWQSGDPGDDVYYMHTCRGRVRDHAQMFGTAKIEVDRDWKAGKVTSVRLEPETIDVSAAAPQEDNRDDSEWDPIPVG